MDRDEFISEPIAPVPGTGDAAAMSRGEPGLPRQFTWRGDLYTVLAVVRTWKTGSREGGSPTGELYLRKHWYEVRTECGRTMTIYCLRQARRGEKRWWLYTIRRP